MTAILDAIGNSIAFSGYFTISMSKILANY